jgi:phosphoribosylglycinamide formyltransferase-1
MKQYAFFVSANGSRARNAYRNRRLIPGEYSLIIADRECSATEYFRKETSIEVIVVPFKKFLKREDFDIAVAEILDKKRIEYLFLNCNRLLGKAVLTALPDRIINCHGSLLPAFPGMYDLGKAIESVLFFGTTVHLIDESLDGGPIISQLCLPKPSRDHTEKFLSILFRYGMLMYLDVIAAALRNELLITDKMPLLLNREYGYGPINPVPLLTRF